MADSPRRREVPRADGVGALAGALAEALAYPVGGEVVVRSRERVGRIYALGGKLAWATASPLPRTLGQRLAAEAGVDAEEMRAAFDECKRTGRSFGEALVAWNLVDEATLRRVLGDQAAEALGEILTWPAPQALVVPSDRVYRANLTFEPEALLARAGEARSEARDRAAALLKRLAEGPAPPPPGADDALPRPPPRPVPPSDRVLEAFHPVGGYRAAAVMTPTGEALLEDTVFPSLDAGLFAATLNEAFRTGDELCRTLGLKACREQVLVTELGQVVLRCTGEGAARHLHGLVLLARAGNLALARLRLASVLDDAMEALG